jgi:hypothetical protein
MRFLVDIAAPPRFLRATLFAALGLLFATPFGSLDAQTLTSGVLTGVVRDQSGAPLEDVELTVTDREAGGTRLFTTARDGVFRFALLPTGSYTVRAERLGYRPRVIEGVPLRPGEQLNVEVSLAAAPGTVDVAEVVRFQGSGAGSRAGISQWLSPLRLDALPWERRELGEVAGLSTASTEALEVEGLPASLSTLMLDGVPFAPVRHPALDRGEPGIIALPLGAFESADLVTADPDMQWAGFAGGALSAHTRRGASAFTARSFAAGSGGPLRSSQYIDGSSPSNTSLWGGVLLSGPIIPDTAHFVVGFEAHRLETPRPRPWASADAAGPVVAAGRSAHSVGLEPYTQPFVLQTTVASGFGRFDWQLGNENVLSVRAGFGGILPVDRDTEVARATVPGAVAEGGDLLLSASLSSGFNTGLAHEIRVGVSRSTREYTEGTALLGGDPVLPSTYVTDGALHFGADPRLPGKFERTAFTTAQALEIPTGDHRFQLGLDTDISSFDDTYAYSNRGEFIFGGAQEFASGDGIFVRTQLSSPRASFTRFGLGAYLQDIWNAAPGLRVVAGLRFDVETLPGDEIRLSQRWLDYTGIANSEVPERVATLSPRVGITWDVGGDGLWVVRASAGGYAMPVMPDVLSEVISIDGTPTVQRVVGDLDDWPAAPGASPTSPARLSILGPDFRGPFTGRASFGVSRHVANGTTLHLSATYRETEFLPRREDINRLATPTATDQHNRPIYGPLMKVGQLVASSRPNRRFGDFDVVSALNADGWSRYWGVTAAVEHDAGEELGLFARYTYSRTTDNWLARSDMGPDAQISPFAEVGSDDWREGVSDYDLTHRFAAGAEVRLAGTMEPKIAAVYRFRSGHPFTPGFRTGVDVNGDGSGRNDPAFVDESVTGVTNLMSEWDCLQEQRGRFVERNSCREPGVHSLDARFSLGVVRSDGIAADVVVEGLNLIDPAIGELDAALYRIDASRPLLNDTARRVYTLPLIANPDFGTRLGRVGTGRTFRVGVQVTF